ncbi:MAG: isocitrate/isopropylmalate dehydrogenase family protein [Deltaproteobacteria bacterium]|nr:isocitrate/isopropylmalate dehydrogenase family protein [Deltaproteobacteria bacterium]MBW1963211.1 isocitrate/isopropylmalate dehydrogenase family protein [Deltaproteobacteria bacterium]MBW2154732.1 isocitrate/isopropylmalate dehydrogenase family protein [Deltaproteobacteria bacterium]
MHKVALMKGDGIGPEIVDAAVQVIEATGVDIDWIHLEGGQSARKKLGASLPDETLSTYLECGVGFKGPFSVEMEDERVTPRPRGVSKNKQPRSYNSATNALRREGGGFAAVRLARNYRGVPAPIHGLDVVIVREINEDIYVASEYTVEDDTAVALKIITRKASEAVVRFAFEFAKRNRRKRVTAVHKANVLKQTDGLFVRVAREIACNYPEIEFNDRFVDASCAMIVSNPSWFDVAVMPNQYGDIMSDLCAAAAGSLGLGAGATYGTQACLFEPVHGTAPDIAGKGIANPVSQILSGALMLRHLGEEQYAAAIELAVKDVLSETANHTPDLGGNATTQKITQAIVDRISGHNSR